MADDDEGPPDLVLDTIKAYLDDGRPPGPLISLLVSFRIVSASARERLLLQPLAESFSSRNSNVDDEGLHIYNVENRLDSIYGLSSLLFFLDEADCAQYAKDIMTGLSVAIYHVDPAVQNTACLSLLSLLHFDDHVQDDLMKSFENIFKALLMQCQTRLDRYPIVHENVSTLNRRLAKIVAPVPGNVDPTSLQVFIQQFERLGDTLCPRSRRFQINWLLDLLCDEMLGYLAVILAGLFNMTSFPKASPDAFLFMKSETESLELIRSFYEKVRAGKGYHHVSANIEATVSVVARNLQKPPSANAQAEALKWASVLIQMFPREVFKCAEFETVFLQGLDIPQAHFLMGIHIAIKGSDDLEAARTHLFKAINHVKEATHAMAMVAILSENHDVAKFFFDMAYTEGWTEVAKMQKVVTATVMEIMESTTSATFNYKRPACDRSHNIGSRCQSCYMYDCAEELMSSIQSFSSL